MQATRNPFAEGGNCLAVGVVRFLTADELAPHMLDVKTSLVTAIKPLNQLFKGCFAGDDHELVAPCHGLTTAVWTLKGNIWRLKYDFGAESLVFLT